MLLKMKQPTENALYLWLGQVEALRFLPLILLFLVLSAVNVKKDSLKSSFYEID